jgi:hypothetical protein
MKCPHCHAAAQPEQEFCQACGFSAATLRSYLGDQWVKLERITDAAHCLRLEEVRRCEIALDDFERCLPQAFFAIYLGVLPHGLNVAELGFWLLNQGAFNTHQMMKRNDFGTVLVVDPVTKSISLTLGYAIEGCFTPKQLTHLLETAAVHLEQQDFGGAMLKLIGDVYHGLRKKAQSYIWKPETSANEAGISVQPLRSGHRPTVRAETPVTTNLYR